MFKRNRELFCFRFIGEAITMKNILRNKTTQIFLAALIIFTLHLQIFTQSAFARGSGGGDLAEFKTEKFVASVGIGLASSALGNIVSSGISAQAGGVSAWSGGTNAATGLTYGGMSGAISNYGSAGTWMASYNSMAALNQLGSGINMMGQQQEWDSGTTVFVSSVAQGAVGGLLNPSSTLGTSSKSADGQIRANNESSMNSFNIAESTDKNGNLITRWSEEDLVELNKIKGGTFNNVMKVGSSRPDMSGALDSISKADLLIIDNNSVVATVTDTLENGVKASGWQNAMMSSVSDFTVANCTKAAGVGAISGAVEGAILANNLDDNGKIKPWVSGAAGLAGTFTGGAVASMVAPVVPSKAGSYEDYITNESITKDGQFF